MIVTESFVWINYPKAASTFVRQSLKTLYSIPAWNLLKTRRFKHRFIEELYLPNIRAVGTNRYGSPTPHGLARQIPEQYSHLPIVLSVRDPFERLLSLYHYGDWKKPEANSSSLQTLQKQFPDFPNITFEQFMTLVQSSSNKRQLIIGRDAISIGFQSSALIDFIIPSCFVGAEGHFEFSDWQSFANQISACTFLKAAIIDEELLKYLGGHGFDFGDIKFIKRMGKVNESQQSDVTMPSSASDLLHREWLLRFLSSLSEKITWEELKAAYHRSLRQ